MNLNTEEFNSFTRVIAKLSKLNEKSRKYEQIPDLNCEIPAAAKLPK